MRVCPCAGDRKLDRDELKVGLQEYGLVLSDREVDTVLNAFDKNKDGKIDFDEFLRGIRVCAPVPSVTCAARHCQCARCGCVCVRMCVRVWLFVYVGRDV